MASYQDLMTQANALFAQAEALRTQEREKAIAEIKAQMKAAGISPADLGAGKGRGNGSNKAGTAGKSNLPAKFKGPNGQLWSGLGRYPDWLREEIQTGKSKADFAI